VPENIYMISDLQLEVYWRRHQQQFSINMLAGTVGGGCQSYWKMHHWQSEHECSTCVMVLSVTPVMADGYVEEDPLHGLHARHIFTCGVSYNPSCMQLLLTTKRDIALWMPVRLSATTPVFWTDAAVHDETCRGVHWIPWRTFWALLMNVLFQL
jgi:hypothetical protein